MTAWSERVPEAFQRNLAIGLIGLSLAIFGALAPLATTALGEVRAFIPAYESALVACNLVTAALLFGQFAYFRSRALLCLASGYLFTGCVALVHALTFPGLVTDTGLLGAGPQTTAWLYMFWHGGFPLFVCGYALLDRKPSPGTVSRLHGVWPVLACVAMVAVLVAAAALLATLGESVLPVIMTGQRHSASMIIVIGCVWGLSGLALLVLWVRPKSTVLDLWLMVVMWAWIFDIGLSAVLDDGRFDLGFYAGRIYGLVAASVVLVALLVENGRLYVRLAERDEELDRARAAAIEAEAAKGAFIATMSHEIRTPMNGVMGMLELLSLTKLTGEQRTTLEIICESGRSLMRIIDDILDFSKIEAGRLELRLEAASPARLVEAACEAYSANAESKGISLTWSIDRNLGSAYLVDPLRVRQVLQNLISNAIKFTSIGSVTVRADLLERRGNVDVVRIGVRDTGPGVSLDDRLRLFKPFSQGSARPGTGTGLGLSICHRLSLLMGGSLELESQPGHGALMTVTLPLTRAKALVAVEPARPAAPDPDPTPRAASGVVLVVDDHPVNLMVMARQLRVLGYEPVVANSGAQAIDRIRSGGIQAVLTDCQMPGMDGYELARRIRTMEHGIPGARVPIIACTANAMNDEGARCFEAGMDDCVAKPVSLPQLSEALERWIPANPSVEEDIVDSEVLAEFWRYNTHDVRDLKAAIQSRAVESVLRSAHRIKGATAAIGVAALTTACAELERAATAPDWTSVEAALDAFERETVRLGERIGVTSED